MNVQISITLPRWLAAICHLYRTCLPLGPWGVQVRLWPILPTRVTTSSRYFPPAGGCGPSGPKPHATRPASSWLQLALSTRPGTPTWLLSRPHASSLCYINTHYITLHIAHCTLHIHIALLFFYFLLYFLYLFIFLFYICFFLMYSTYCVFMFYVLWMHLYTKANIYQGKFQVGVNLLGNKWLILILILQLISTNHLKQHKNHGHHSTRHQNIVCLVEFICIGSTQSLSVCFSICWSLIPLPASGIHLPALPILCKCRIESSHKFSSFTVHRNKFPNWCPSWLKS